MKRKRQGTYTKARKYARKTYGPRMPPGFVRVSQRRNDPMQIISYQQTRPGGEIKSIDVVNPTNGATPVAFTINSTAQLTPLNIVTSGSSMFNRIGRKISMKSVHLQGYMVNTGNVQANGSFARIIIVYDKQPNGALPNYTDVFTDQINNTGGDIKISNPSSGINLNNRDRFEIIVDRRFFLPGTTATGVSAQVAATCDPMHFEIYSKLKNREVHFKADSSPGVIGDIATGSLVLITIGDKASGSDPWGMDLNIRLRYSDL